MYEKKFETCQLCFREIQLLCYFAGFVEIILPSKILINNKCINILTKEIKNKTVEFDILEKKMTFRINQLATK